MRHPASPSSMVLFSLVVAVACATAYDEDQVGSEEAPINADNTSGDDSSTTSSLETSVSVGSNTTVMQSSSSSDDSTSSDTSSSTAGPTTMAASNTSSTSSAGDGGSGGGGASTEDTTTMGTGGTGSDSTSAGAGGASTMDSTAATTGVVMGTSCQGLPEWDGGNFMFTLSAGDEMQHDGRHYRATEDITFPNDECAPGDSPPPAAWCAGWFEDLGPC